MKKEKGITLIALILAIIVLIILAGISINALNNNGIFERAKEARDKWKNAQNEEEIQIARYSNEIENWTRSSNTSNYKRVLLYPENKQYNPANDTSQEYNLNEDYTHYEYLLVECNHNNGGSSFTVGTVLAPIITEDIILQMLRQHPGEISPTRLKWERRTMMKILSLLLISSSVPVICHKLHLMP